MKFELFGQRAKRLSVDLVEAFELELFKFDVQGHFGVDSHELLRELERATVFADPGNSLYVVDRVARKRHHIDQLTGLEPESFVNVAQSRAFVAHRIPEADARTYELCEVFVAGNNHYLEALTRGAQSKRPQDVVGLVAIDYEKFYAQRFN